MRTGRPRKSAPSEAAEIARLYQAGVPSLLLARQFRCHRVTILETVRRHGVAVRRKGRTALPPDQLRVGGIPVELAVRRLEAGTPRGTLAADLGLSTRRLSGAISEWRRRQPPHAGGAA